MMIVFVQPYSQKGPGGSSKIFSNLICGREHEVKTAIFGAQPKTIEPATEVWHQERILRIHPLESTRFRPWLDNLWPLTWQRCSSALEEYLDAIGPKHVHSIAHGLGFYPAYQWASRHDVDFSLTVHDDIRHLFQGHLWLNRIEEWLLDVWQNATHRFVISPEMGKEYCRRYGDREWIQITDGLEDDRIASGPRSAIPNRLNVYFAGGLNVPYEPNFLALQSALKRFSEERSESEVRLIARGGRRLKGEDTSAPPIEVRPFASQEEVLKDLDEVDVLYLPLSIEAKYANFAKFSLSTKMITYLGSGLPIFYHGPEDSAAYRLLQRNDACLACFSNDPAEIAAVLESLPQHRERIVHNAIALAQREFQIKKIRERFWSRIDASVGNASGIARTK